MRKVKNFLADIFNSEDLIQLGRDSLQMLLFLIVGSSITFGIALVCSRSKFSLNISKWIVIILLIITLVIVLFSIIVYLYNCLKSLLNRLFRKN